MPSTSDRHTRRRRVLKDAPRLTGDKLTPAQVASIEARIQETPTGCWLWLGSCDPSGYPQVCWKARRYRVYRLYFEYVTGAPLAADVELDHVCCIRACCNPAHLSPCSHAENLRRIRCRGAASLFSWRSARDYRLNLAHLVSIEAES